MKMFLVIPDHGALLFTVVKIYNLCTFLYVIKAGLKQNIFENFFTIHDVLIFQSVLISEVDKRR